MRQFFLARFVCWLHRAIVLVCIDAVFWDLWHDGYSTLTSCTSSSLSVSSLSDSVVSAWDTGEIAKITNEYILLIFCYSLGLLWLQQNPYRYRGRHISKWVIQPDQAHLHLGALFERATYRCLELWKEHMRIGGNSIFRGKVKNGAEEKTRGEEEGRQEMEGGST
jgi:hypothetical protein